MRLFLRSLFLTFFAVTLANLSAFSQTATIKTDQLDYPPGSTVLITGTGWQAGETVTLQVLHEGETGDNATSGAHAPFTVVADANGNVSSTWIVPLDEDELGATLLLTAVGGSSGRTANWTFTDAGAIAFTVSGLPPNSSCTVTVTYWTVPPKNGVSQQVTTTPQLISVNNGGSATSFNVTANPGSTITWTFSSSSSPTGYIYSSSSYNSGTPVNESTGFTVPASGNLTGNSAVIGNYTTCPTPSIIGEPANQNTIYGNPTSPTFSVAASGDISGYQWQVLTTEIGASWSNISSANSTSYTVVNPRVSMSGYQYRVVISGTCAPSFTSDAATLTVDKKAASVTPADGTKEYGSADPALTGSTTGFLPADNVVASYSRAAGETVTGGPYTISATLTPTAVLSNYNITYNTAKFTITTKAASVTPAAASKYCGQPDPSFTGTLTGFLAADNVTAAYSRTPTVESAATSYTINATLNPTGVLTNYNITYNTASFTINSVSIDASNTSTAIQLGTATKLLTATVTSGSVVVPNATVTFTVGNNGNITPITVTQVTDANGVATVNLSSGSLAVGLYQVTAVAGSGCSTSVAYFSVYDPSAGFVTGGGWINSPVGAYSADPTLTGKANFGFNAQYKKGNNVPDGNTEFQFQAGNLNFKSTSYGTGSLVIAGAKAIFQGTGTINGSGSYSFMISAIDGSISGGGGTDKFRIKIQTAGGGVVYDNNVNAANNADPTTCLGGGSIVIHSTGNTKRTMDTVKTNSNLAMLNPDNAIEPEGNGKLSIHVMPNPTSYYFTLILKSLSKENVKVTVTDITGRVVEQRTGVSANSTIQLGSQYHPGIYIAEFMQGNDRITIRLIKEGK